MCNKTPPRINPKREGSGSVESLNRGGGNIVNPVATQQGNTGTKVNTIIKK